MMEKRHRQGHSKDAAPNSAPQQTTSTPTRTTPMHTETERRENSRSDSAHNQPDTASETNPDHGLSTRRRITGCSPQSTR